MAFQQLLVVLAFQQLHGQVVFRNRIAVNSLIVHVVGSRCNKDSGIGSISHLHVATHIGHSTIGHYFYTHLGLQLASDTLVLYIINNIGMLVLGHSTALNSLLVALIAHPEVQGFLLAGCQLYDNGVIGLRSKGSTNIFHISHIKTGGTQSITQVQFATIIAWFSPILVVERKHQVAQGQILLSMGSFKESLVNQRLSLLFFTFKNQASHIPDAGLGIRIVVIVRRAAPEGFFVQLYLLCTDTAIHHGT